MMKNNLPDLQLKKQIEHFEMKVNKLLSLVERLTTENHQLKLQRKKWQHERSKLYERDKLIQDKIETTIRYLKGLK